MDQWWDERTGRKNAETPEDRETAVQSDESTPDYDQSVYTDAPEDHPPPAPSPRRKDPPPPGAIFADTLPIHGESIRVSDILEPILPKLEKLADELPAPAYYTRAADIVRLQIVENVAQELIWRRASTQINDDIKPQLDKAVDKTEKDRINREFQGRETLYVQYLTKQGRTRDEIRERLRRAIVIDSYLRDRLLPLVPPPRRNELFDYYQTHRTEFSRPERREMWLIEVPIEEFLDFRKPITRADEQAAMKSAREKIEAAAAALDKGEPFEEVAKTHSLGPHREDGGAWGYITAASDRTKGPLQGRWAEPSRILFELEPDQRSDIIEFAKCFFIVKAGKFDPGMEASFQEAQPHIVDTLKQQRFARLRADFLQGELDKITIGSLDDFMQKVMDEIPPSKDKSVSVNPDLNR